ncbi:hypothetical protein [Actinomadura kijaniata]|uniref:hypothetical protein n=1 Tax=Actinomadura kijaniata TaxID=46161 RepID=UPI0012FCB99A|nr:hypothetical protein [Actinomadura kijaniata]
MAMRARSVHPPHPAPRPATTRTLRATACLLTGTLLATTTACGGTDANSGTFRPRDAADNGAPATPAGTADPATDPSHPSALPTPQVDQAVLTRYREYQQVYKRVYERNDPTELSTVATDPLLTHVTKDVERMKAQNQIWRFTNISNAKVYARAKDGLTVYVVDCMRTLAAYRFNARTGQRVEGGPGEAHLHRTAVRYDNGTWKVSDTIRDKKC